MFEFGNFRIYSYGVMVALGFLVAVYFASREGQRAGISSQKFLDLGLYTLIFGIIGARALHVLLDLGYYANQPLDIIRINRGGLAFHGGLVTGVITAYFFIKRHRMPLWKTADIFIPYVALGQSIGRMGCLLNGCCYGTPTHLPIGVHLPGHILPLHPTQLYSSIFLLSTFLILKKIYRKKRSDGTVFFSYLLIFSVGRFFLDFFRGDLRPVLFGLKTSQFISIGVFIFLLLKGTLHLINELSKDK